MEFFSIKSIDRAIKSDFTLDAASLEIVEVATKRGYVVRLSHTQAQWTEEGLAKAQSEIPSYFPPRFTMQGICPYLLPVILNDGRTFDNIEALAREVKISSLAGPMAQRIGDVYGLRFEISTKNI